MFLILVHAYMLILRFKGSVDAWKLKKILKVLKILETFWPFIKTEEDFLIESRPIVTGPVFHTNGISEIFLYIMEAVYSLVSQIFKGSFDFTQRLEKQCQNNTLLSTSQFVFYSHRILDWTLIIYPYLNILPYSLF